MSAELNTVVIVSPNISINVWKIMKHKTSLMFLIPKIILSIFKVNILSL